MPASSSFRIGSVLGRALLRKPQENKEVRRAPVMASQQEEERDEGVNYPMLRNSASRPADRKARVESLLRHQFEKKWQSDCGVKSLRNTRLENHVGRTHTLCYAMVLSSRKSGFRAGLWPAPNRESLKTGPPAGRAGRRADFEAFQNRIRPKPGPEARFPARKH